VFLWLDTFFAHALAVINHRFEVILYVHAPAITCGLSIFHSTVGRAVVLFNREEVSGFI
jgi:hypothetical protein